MLEFIKFLEIFSSFLAGSGIALEQMLCKMLEEQMKRNQPGVPNTPFTPSARMNPKVCIH